jgi:serine/threonine protein kinase
VAAGLLYLHSFDVVHGDLTGSNILIDSDGKAFLADFGLSNVVAETCGPLYVTSSIGGSVRWAAPEHFRISEGSHISTVTKYSDIYSYGSVTLQVLSGKLPYHDLRRDAEVLIELHHGIHPPRPPELADEHWELISQCWAKHPSARPNIKEVSKRVQHHYQAAAGGQVVPRSPTSTLSTLADHDTVDHRASPPPLTLVCAFARKVLLHIRVIPCCKDSIL